MCHMHACSSHTDTFSRCLIVCYLVPLVIDHRYAPGDHIESWLHELLCLDATTHMPKPPPKLPHPSSCDLYYVERDTLFSYHKVGGPQYQYTGTKAVCGLGPAAVAF
jgi:hypothetical protein